jgi:hypothetical protein
MTENSDPETLKRIEEKIDSVNEKLLILCNQGESKDEKQRKVEEYTRQHGRIDRRGIQKLVDVSSQGAHDIINRIVKDEASWRIRKQGNKHWLVYYPEAEAKKRKMIVQLVRESEKGLKLSEIIAMFTLDRDRARKIMSDIQAEEEDLKIDESMYWNAYHSRTPLTLEEGIRLVKKSPTKIEGSHSF